MNSPVQHPPRPQPQPRAEPPRTPSTASPSEARQPQPNVRRADAERLRRLCDESASPASLSADGMFFSQLLVPPVTEDQSESGFAGSSFSTLFPAEGVPTQLIDELAQRLPQQPDGPLSLTLLMPNLGKVQVNANKRDNQWSIELGFARRGVLKRLQPHQRNCESALEQALGCDVDLSLHEEAAT
ncbi:type III secretion system HrpP C-terminal domain-containing protein [Pseudomonas sp. CFBP 8772]|uniref:type III secretion system HrpP C-terminal domain-containing protein n=1 Tax=Pseudomonas sp. CFBP 8772 TaxID=2775284 RepID=UPI001786E78A|nr:type III secretion system HrpP C-terminal domain-containing protein [Pseudomonas sp. CFBP 8772]MBD8599785.1 flagellar hook-length control protein FliK [Pseudomonas sp. CFBP 8772]